MINDNNNMELNIDQETWQWIYNPVTNEYFCCDVRTNSNDNSNNIDYVGIYM